MIRTKGTDNAGQRFVQDLTATPVGSKGRRRAVDPAIWGELGDNKLPRIKQTTKQPTNAELQARREAALPRGIASATKIFAARAENAYVWDVEGRRYIDFAGGIGVLNTGHRNPRVMKRVKKQIDRFTHTCFQVVPYESYVAVCERLNALAPIKGDKKSVLFSTGAEAVENAVKIARAATGRSAVISFSGGFHGRTLMGMALTGKVTPYKVGFGPFPAEVFHAPFPNAYRGVSVDDAIKGLEKIFKADVDPQRVAAIIIEPVQGEGGFLPAPKELFEKLRALCDQHGILLIADEVQSGFARTGKMFAMEHSGVCPDLITTAKSLAGGFTLSGVIGRAEIMDKPIPGGLGGTYAGTPLACEAALGVMESIEHDRLLERSNAIGEQIRARFTALASEVGTIGEVRGLGGMMAIELVQDQATKAPAGDLTKQVVARALEKGLITLACGTDGNVLRILVPLTATEDALRQGLDLLEASIREASAAQAR